MIKAGWAALLLLAVGGWTGGAARAQDRVRQGTSSLRLDAVDVSAAPRGQFVFFASFLDQFRKPQALVAPKSWTVSLNGEPVDGTLSVKLLRDSTEGVSVVLVLNTAIATEGEQFEHTTKGATKLLNALRVADLSAVVAYGKTVEATGALVPAHNESVSWIQDRKPEGLTPQLYDAVEKAVSFFPLDFSSVGPNRAVVVVSDGFDEIDDSPALRNERLKKLQGMARDRNVRVNIVGVGIEDVEALESVRKLAVYSGGTYREARTYAKVESFLGDMEAELMGQHVLTLRTTDFDGGRETAFKITGTHGGKDYTSDAVIRFVEEPPSHLMSYLLWGGGGLLGLGLLLLVVRLIGRMMARRAEDDAPAETGPELILCAQCNNQVPAEWKICKYCEALPHYGRLVVRSPGDLNGKAFFIKETLSNIGSADGNSVVLRDPSVSKRHCGIKVQDNRFELADFGSTNGVFINEQRITKQFLRDGDTLAVGLVELQFSLK